MRFLYDSLKKFWVFSWAALLTSVLFVPITASALLSSTGDLAFNISRIWAWMMLKVIRARVRIRNKDRIKAGQSYIIVANHQSSLDIPAMAAALGIQFRWTIKKSLLWIPLFGYALYASKNIFIDRSNREKAIRSIKKGLKRLSPGTSLIFFAEGSRSKDGKLKKFKKGAFVAAIDNNLPILPVTVKGSAKLMPKDTISFHSGIMELVVGEPIDTRSRNMEDMEKLIEETRKTITGALSPDYPAVRSKSARG